MKNRKHAEEIQGHDEAVISVPEEKRQDMQPK